MVYKFRLLSDEVNNFKREITIDASATFQDLKNAICDSVAYDKNQLCSFFICDDNWEKEKEITLEDMGADSSEDIWLMEDTILEDMIEDEGQKLLFVFDYLTERAFFMEMAEYIPGRNLKDPVCSLSLGHAPSQILEMDLDELDAKTDAKAAANASAMTVDDFDDDEAFADDQYDLEDLDSAGFDEMKF
ncbi:MAG: hypothetical protein K2G24_05490 [Muribaculaceae bacterium]|nr:hypothetical protein [Muribaculaceae bacterium]